MKMYKIEIDEEIWNFLKSKAEPFEDTPNSVLRRLVFGEKSSEIYIGNQKVSISEIPKFPNYTPRALVQILEVIYMIKKRDLNRKEATKLIAKRKNTDYQTIIDKYTRQLGKRAEEIDRLLEDQDLKEFKSLLNGKFENNKNIIDDFFETLNGH